MGNCCGSTATAPSLPTLPLQPIQATPVREVPRRVVPPTSPPRERRPLTPTVRKVLSDKLRYAPRRYVYIMTSPIT
jgi:hypothetical protein